MSSPQVVNTGLSADQADKTIGALFIGIAVASALTGIGFLQTFTFFTNSGRTGRKDRVVLQGLYLPSLLDILQTIFCVMGEYNYVIINFGNTSALTSIFWSLAGHNTITVIIDFCVRCVFVHRIYMPLLKSHAQGIPYSEQCDGDPILAGDPQFCVTRSWSIYQRETTLLSSRVVQYLAMPDNLIYAAIYLVLPKVYHNALLASLNGRTWLGETPCDTRGYNSFHLSSIAPDSTLAGNANADNHKTKDVISIGINPTNSSTQGDVESIRKPEVL
ncbi:hypothetical protein C8Q75DRAFT_806754 [Abortiporus biennis]|nr:hypothetical protein C8Q75DRAFT_806754 [Abortiporus biennis]